MRKLLAFSFFSCATVTFASSAWFLACGSDDASVGPRDAGRGQPKYDGPLLDSRLPPDLEGGAPAPPYLLLSYNYDHDAKTEYSAFSLTAGLIAGGFDYPLYGTNVSGGKSPWVLDQAGDVVRKMDAAKPWLVVSAWNVASQPATDAGKPNANAKFHPAAVAEVGDKAYVVFYDRNTIAVLDTSQAVEGGAPQNVIDVSALHQDGDSDGNVELTSAVYVASHERVYVVLGNIDLNKVDPQGSFQICGSTRSVIAAIDTKTDTLVGVADTGDGAAGSGVIALEGVSPAPQTLVYDAKNDRLIVMTQGCNEAVDGDAGDGGKGPLRGRLIEEVRLADGATSVLYDATENDFPTRLAYADESHAWVQFGGVAHAWDPTSKALGPIVAAPDAFVYDGKGSLVGPRSRFAADGGFDGVDIIAVQTSDGGATLLGSSPVSHPEALGYFEGIEYWPTD